MLKLPATLVAATMLLSSTALAHDAPKLETLKERFGYIVGLQVAERMMQQGMHERLDAEAFFQAFRDRFAGGELQMSKEQIEATIKEIQEEQESAAAAAEQKTLADQAAFLAENKEKDGVQTTASGLQYKIVEAGSGAKPTAGDTVKVHYEGSLLDGTVFDSSIGSGEPATFGVGQVIPGWQEALQLMSVGGKWEVWVPADLAYGATGAGQAIGPHQTLYFKIELLEIVSN